jgi:hypothetical protein
MKFDFKTKIFFLVIIIFAVFGFTKKLQAFMLPPVIDVILPSATHKYYCDLDAIDNGIGTSESPWNSWANAKTGMGAASFPAYLYVKGTETLGVDFDWNISGSGSGSELVITNWTGETATTATDGHRFSITAKYIIFDGSSFSSPAFKWTNSDTATSYTVRPSGSCNQTTVIRRCEISGGLLGLDVQGGIKLYNNKVHDTGSHCVYLSGSDQENCRTPLVKNNIIYNAGRNGIQHNPHDFNENNREIIDGETTGNAIYDCTEHGITVLSGTGPDGIIDGLLISNNIVWGNTLNAVKFSGKGDDYSGTISGVLMYNNTFYGGITNQHGDDVAGEPATTVFRNNIVTGTISHFANCEFVAESNNLTSYATSNFVSVTDTDDTFLTLKSSASTAIDQGYDVSSDIVNDYWGNDRSEIFDIGAYEYVSSDNIAPDAPSGLSVN